MGQRDYLCLRHLMSPSLQICLMLQGVHAYSFCALLGGEGMLVLRFAAAIMIPSFLFNVLLNSVVHFLINIVSLVWIKLAWIPYSI